MAIGAYVALRAVIRAVKMAVRDARLIRRSDRAVATVQWDPYFVILFPEPTLLAGLAVTSVWTGHHVWSAPSPTPSPWELVRLAVGLALCLVYRLLMGRIQRSWAALGTTKMSPGHYIREGHVLLTSGIYGTVRHPTYLAVFTLWLSVGVTFANPYVLALLAFYVIPGYVMYARGEERMLSRVFGADHAAYQSTVPMMLPAPKKRPAHPDGGESRSA